MKTIRFGICALIAFAVLFHGAVEVWAESIFEVGAACLLAIWAWRCWRDSSLSIIWSPLGWPIVWLLLLGLAQFLFHGSVYPYATKQELLRWTAYFILFFLCAQVFREKDDLRALVSFLVVFGFLVALFGIIQHFTFNGKIYWIRPLSQGGLPFGPFVNRNHFAGFMELIAPIGLALLIFRGVKTDQIPLTAVFTTIQIGALILSASRGGIVGFVFAVGLLIVLSRVRGAGQTRIRAAAIVLLAALAMMGWFGAGEVMQRFEKTGTGEVLMGRRVVMAKSSWHIFVDHPWAGTGMGTLSAIYPRYEGLYDGKIIDHAHNDYVELLADTGILGGIFAACFLVIFFAMTLKQLQVRQSAFSLAIHSGALAGCGSLLLHSFVDFNLHIPSNAALFFVMVFVATSPALAIDDVHRFKSRRQFFSVVDSPASTAP